jgi:alcohol dehydrogenase
MNPASATVTLQQPSRIVFGTGCATSCANEFAVEGSRRIAVVATRRARAQVEPLCTALTAQGIDLVAVTDLPPEPTVAAFETAREALRGHRLSGVLGVGGGSALDLAKLLAALHARDEPVSAFYGVGKLPPRALRLVCLPTTAGTGSEVSPNAVLLDERARLKMAVISPHLVPDAAYIDPLLTLTAPPELTAATGMDALVHCIEGFANRVAHPAVDLHALEGVRLIGAHLAAAVRDGSNASARTAVALGSLYGGLCLGPVNTAAVHALSYPLGSAFHVPHGLANALLLPHVMRFNVPAAPARYAALAQALGVERRSTERATAAAGVEHIEALAAECGLPRSLSACGVTAADIPAMVEGAMQVTRLLRNNPREVTSADAAAIYEAALSS